VPSFLKENINCFKIDSLFWQKQASKQ